MSISDYYRSRLEAVSLLIKWLLISMRWHLGSNVPELSPNPRSNIIRKAVKDRLRVVTFDELRTTTMEAIEETICAVCLSEVEGRDRVWELRNCSHVFHKGCLDTWLEHADHVSCPLCRAQLVTQAQAQRADVGPPEEPSWVVDRLLYLFGDDLL